MIALIHSRVVAANLVDEVTDQGAALGRGRLDLDTRRLASSCGLLSGPGACLVALFRFSIGRGIGSLTSNSRSHINRLEYLLQLHALLARRLGRCK